MRHWALLVALAAVYFVAGKLGLSFATVHSSASAVWPPTGIALGAFLIWGNRVWPAIFVGAFLVNITTAGSIATSLGIAAGNTIEGFAGAYLVNRFAGGAGCFFRARDVFKFVGLAAVVATALSATIGVASLELGGYASAEQAEAIWLTWWLGDASGALIVTPLVLLWHEAPRRPLTAERRREALLMHLAVVCLGAAYFFAPQLRGYPLSFLLLPPLAWIALRFGPRQVATAIALIATIAVIATETDLGPFALATRGDSLLLLQGFMAMVVITLMPMAALVREHRVAVAEAEEATRARDVFLAMLSHELRNPLQAIVNALHIISSTKSAESSARAVAVAQRQSTHLTRLLNDLLDVSRAVSGKIAVVLEPVRLDEAVRRCVEALRVSNRLESRTLTLDAEAVTVRADASRLEQIVANLMSNAVKFTSSGGTIRVSAREEGGEAVLRVQDDGVGIAPELLPKVFELFTQGERKLDRREGGLGIGLTLVRTLAELQGGSVEAHSDGAGKGSEFVVRLPLIPVATSVAMDRDPVSAATGPGPISRLRVLIIEDNADARETLHDLLTAQGHDVHQSAGGEEGLRMAEKEKPDVVLIDIGLPHIDGYEVARRLRAREPTLGARPRLIAITGYGQPEDVRRAREAGFDAHLVKPVDPSALHDVMR